MSLITGIQVEQFHELGYFVTEPMWSDAELESVREECDRLHVEAIRNAEADGHAERIEIARLRPFIGRAHTRSEVLRSFVRSPLYLEACATLIGLDADLYYNQVVIKPPARGRHFGWHQDSGYVVTEPLAYITCWTAIDRTYVENGCIWIIPGSHKRGLIGHRRNETDQSTDAVLDNEDEAVAVEMQAGQVAIFSSLMLHKSGPNVSQELRRGYVPQYHVPGVIKVESGEPFGDQLPVLRGGNPV